MYFFLTALRGKERIMDFMGRITFGVLCENRVYGTGFGEYSGHIDPEYRHAALVTEKTVVDDKCNGWLNKVGIVPPMKLCVEYGGKKYTVTSIGSGLDASVVVFGLEGNFHRFVLYSDIPVSDRESPEEIRENARQTIDRNPRMRGRR